MPRVLEVLAPPDGGVAEHVLRLAEGLGDHGWDVDVAAAAGSEFLPRFRAAGANVFELPFVRAPGPKDLAAGRALRAIDRAGRYPVVHAHSSKAGAVARLALPRAGRIAYTPHCFAFSGDFAGAGKAVYRVVERTLLRRTGALVAVSRWEAEEARRELSAPEGLVRVIHNGAPEPGTAEPDPGLIAFAAGRPLAGMVSVLRPQKDPLTFVRAVALLRREGRLGFCATIVGNGELGEAVRAEIDALGLGADMALLPFAGAVAPYLRALDLFVLPSLWESLPISVLEAMAAGVPVLATNVAGTPEAVQDGVTGRLVPPGSPERLAEELASLMADSGARRAAGEAGRARFEASFRVEPMVASIAALYDQLSRPA